VFSRIVVEIETSSFLSSSSKILYVHIAVEGQEDVRWMSEEGGTEKEDEEAGKEVAVRVEEAEFEIETGVGIEARTNMNIGKSLVERQYCKR
jgi:DUF4097 and DUF4098 domain-containing protein YvlB